MLDQDTEETQPSIEQPEVFNMERQSRQNSD